MASGATCAAPGVGPVAYALGLLGSSSHRSSGASAGAPSKAGQTGSGGQGNAIRGTRTGRPTRRLHSSISAAWVLAIVLSRSNRERSCSSSPLSRTRWTKASQSTVPTASSTRAGPRAREPTPGALNSARARVTRGLLEAGPAILPAYRQPVFTSYGLPRAIPYYPGSSLRRGRRCVLQGAGFWRMRPDAGAALCHPLRLP